MPVGMPDGGRDAFTVGADGELLVFQVKFARNPNSIKNPVKWITDAIDKELPNIAKLVKRGASEYILISNISGSSHLDSGRIDKVNRYLQDCLPITAACWWRDDLDRRLDNNFDLKLRYPSLITGTDLFRLALHKSKHGNEGTESRALRAYLAAQYEQDRTVRFKQAELDASALFDIFIDVPVALSRQSRRDKRDEELAAHLAEVAHRGALRQLSAELKDASHSQEREFRYLHGEDGGILLRLGGRHGRTERVMLGAADALLDPVFLREVRLVVLEGAPGQGKSTLTQYLVSMERPAH